MSSAIKEWGEYGCHVDMSAFIPPITGWISKTDWMIRFGKRKSISLIYTYNQFCQAQMKGKNCKNNLTL